MGEEIGYRCSVNAAGVWDLKCSSSRKKRKKMDALKITALHISDPREAAAHISSPAPSDPPSPPGGRYCTAPPSVKATEQHSFT